MFEKENILKVRKLNDDFIVALKEGVLSPLLALVKSDSSLCLELRGDYINVYYRGGNLMKVKHRSSGPPLGPTHVLH